MENYEELKFNPEEIEYFSSFSEKCIKRSKIIKGRKVPEYVVNLCKYKGWFLSWIVSEELEDEIILNIENEILIWFKTKEERLRWTDGFRVALFYFYEGSIRND